MIIYQYGAGRIRVLLDGKRVGTIRAVKGTVTNGSGGYFYEATGGRRGETFSTIQAVQRSLEAE